jgi:hypothetical protein
MESAHTQAKESIFTSQQHYEEYQKAGEEMRAFIWKWTKNAALLVATYYALSYLYDHLVPKYEFVAIEKNSTVAVCNRFTGKVTFK